jgi:hypothetical protein
MCSKNIFFVDPRSAMCDGARANQPRERERKPRVDQCFWVLFPTGQKYPVRYTETLDQYEVELPCGVFGGAELRDLRRELNENFVDVRITR